MTIDYDKASQTYDSTRQSDGDLAARFARQVNLCAETDVLDFGCGTGNYLLELQSRFGCRCFGVEPSAGMRRQAKNKGPELMIRAGNHEMIPFAGASFDFIYLTDVIHHVPDLAILFRELARVLRPAHPDSDAEPGRLCIVTESHAQIEARFYNRYFPSLVENELFRYPPLDIIIDQAQDSGLHHLTTETFPQSGQRLIDAHFIQNVAQKNYSMFRLLGQTEYEAGLQLLRADAGRSFEPGQAGTSLIWFAHPLAQ